MQYPEYYSFKQNRWMVLLLLLASCSSGPQVKVGEQSAIPVKKKTELADLLSQAQEKMTADSESHNRWTREVLLALQAERAPKLWTQEWILTERWSVDFENIDYWTAMSRRGLRVPVDRVLPADLIKPTSYQQRVATEGRGVPVLLALEDSEILQQHLPYRPRYGIYLPATVLLDFTRRSDGGQRAVLRFIDPDRALAASPPLATDLTAAVEMNLDRPDVRKNALGGLLKPANRQDDIGLFGVRTHLDQRIPVFMVHGLKSDAHIWKNLVNGIFADPVLREKFEPVMFQYPSGLSVPQSARRLREAIVKYRQFWDPDGDDAAMSRGVVIGHSMGGLLSRMQVIDSGEAIRGSFFRCPLEEVPWLGAERREILRGSLYFQADPDLQRAVFIAVPHRGSQIADWWIVRMAIRVIKLPGDVIQLAQTALTEDSSVLNPALLDFHRLGLRSVDMLSPKHPFFVGLNSQPIQVPYHSIIGDRGRGDTPESSDGVVPYWSSHLEGAASELIIPHPHGCVESPEAVQEVLRILHIHLQGS